MPLLPFAGAPGSGGGGAPTNATYVTLSNNATLTNERVLTGTSNQITVTDNGANSTVVLSIATGYLGQTSITTLGTIATGTWNGTAIIGTYGGTGVNNGTKTFTYLKNISFTAADDTGVYTLPTGTKTLLATDGAGTSLTGIPYTLTGTANQVVLSAGTGNITFSLPQSINTGATPTFASLTLTAASSLTLGTGSTNTGAIVLKNSTNNNTFTIQPGATGSSISLTLPTANAGGNGYLLSSTTGGVLSWVAASSGSPGGADTNIQYNDGSAFGGDANFTWNKTTKVHVITSTASAALSIGANGATNPALLIDASTASSATGISIKSAAAGGKVTITSISSASAEDISIDAKGGGVVYLANATAASVYVNAAMTVNGTLSMATNRGITVTGTQSFYGLDAATAPFIMNSLGSDYGKLQNDSAHLWSLAHTSTGGSALGTPVIQFNDTNGTLFPNGKIVNYNGVATTGWGVPSIYGTGRSTGQTAANASVATYTVGAADGSFLASANILVTTSSAENFTATVSYTDEGNTARTLTFNFQTIAGVIGTAINFANGAVPYEGVPVHLRCKASTAITIKTASGGTYTGCTYNVEGMITQIA